MSQNEPSDKEQAAMEEGLKFGMGMLRQLPGDRLALEYHMTGVLIVFWSALWGTFGTEYARGFIVLRERPRHSCRGGIARHAKRAPFSRILRLACYLYTDQA